MVDKLIVQRLSQVFKESLELYRILENPPENKWTEAIGVVRLNSEGKIWLVGGSVYRKLANYLYGGSETKADLDFIVQTPKPRVHIPGWSRSVNGYGSPRLIKDGVRIDVVPLASMESIQCRKLQPTIENYLTGVPLTIQSIAYDIDEGKLIGTAGIEALFSRTVGVNNAESAASASHRKNITVAELVRQKAEQLRFIPGFPQ